MIRLPHSSFIFALALVSLGSTCGDRRDTIVTEPLTPPSIAECSEHVFKATHDGQHLTVTGSRPEGLFLLNFTAGEPLDGAPSYYLIDDSRGVFIDAPPANDIALTLGEDLVCLRAGGADTSADPCVAKMLAIQSRGRAVCFSYAIEAPDED